MKVQKRKRLKRAAALLFSFVLIAGTSVNVFAQENDTVTEIVSESSLETEAVTENPDTAPNENQREESDITPDENQPAEPDTTPDENQPAEPDTAPDENQPAEPDTTPDESQPTEPDTAPDENQPAEPGTTPDESQPIEPDTAPDENQPAEPDTTPDENQPAEPGTTPDENQPEQPDAKPGENQTEKPGISPEKEPSKKADEELSKPATRTLSARSDIQGSSDYMWYTNLNSSTGFDIQGIDNGTKIQTTYGNYGYLTFYETEENGTVKIDTYTAVDMGNSLYGKRELSLLDNGKYVMVKYTVENMGDSVQTFKIGSSADVQIGDNDQAPVVGTSTGLSMSGEPKNNYKFNLFAPTVTTLWYGYYSDANKNVFTDLPNKSTPYTDDSGMAWSWTGTVSPGMTWSRYVLIGVGDLPEPPGNPAITTEELKTGIPEEIIGTAEPYNTVFIEILGSEYTVTADENGDFSLPITLPADTPEGPTGTSCYAISPEGGISDVVDGSIEIIGAPFIILKETETMVGKDSELNEEWYQSFIESSRGDVSYDDSQVKIGETGTYEVIYTAQREGFEDATATLIIEVHIHEFGTEWKFDETSHWRECKCGEKGEVDSHSFGEWVTDQEPTEEAEGTRHRNCEICSYSESGTIPQLDHKHIYGDWQSNETSHWRECKCGEKSEVDSHSFGAWITDKAATASETGTRHRECGVCGYQEEGTIPATGREESTVNNAEESESEEENPPIDDREGNFSKNIEKVDGIPDINVANSETELQLMLLTNAEKQQLRNGANIRVVFDIKDAESTVSSTDKTLIESALNGYTTGQYLDISLYKLIERTRIDINETPKKITVTIEVPENLRNADSTNKRKFAVIRVHNGMTEFLRDLDDDDNTVTIETDRFSTYALVYQDGESGTAYGNIISQNPNTGNHSIMDLFMILVMMVSGIGFLSLYFSSRKKN